MLTLIVSQAAVAPLLLSLLYLLICKKLKVSVHIQSSCLPLIWVINYLWITNLPSFPPKQAIDWLWITVIAAICIECISKGSQIYRFKNSALATLLIFVSIKVSWPVLTYAANWNSHWIIWLEFLITIACFSALVIFKPKETHATTPIAFSVISGLVGIASIVSGSLLIGLLGISFGAVHFLFSFTALTRVPVTISGVSIVLAFCLLLISRTYANIPLFTALLILLAYTLIFTKSISMKFRLSGAGSAITLAAAWLAYVEISIKADSAYY